MGLISFLKNKGKNIFGKEEKTATKEVTVSKEQQLKKEVERFGFSVDDMKVQLQGEQVTVTGKAKDTATAERVSLALGNVDGISSVDNRLTVAAPTVEAKYYTVKDGDSLSKISKAMYGDPMKYEQIFEANKPMLEHPDKIYPGQTLRIPQA
ncbi:peptidoglycan-binding protein LysM [Neolewinella antarctica]|uniref:Nucleoid-associated protein YgaU n=1 Tax=Neolewinella antarctica TaxID=442734 RepID=A0ABX0XDD0_9BACT|nr:peptidoglycan-binding protein LysM [Neolewinella antarctica]NJC27217.1 nucleoid-associated protein YgaU [Neolewinella antarctica]